MAKYLFTSESVSEGHPDKLADQISDALLDEYLKRDPDSKVACETLVTTGLVVCAGEVRSKESIDIQKIVRKTIEEVGYTKSEYRFDSNSCGIVSTIHEQSDDIYQGIDKGNPFEQGAGDQGIMFGYACRDTVNYMPMSMEIANIILKELASIRKDGNVMTYLRPDSKSQVTIEYEDGKPNKIDTIVISTQHDENVDVLKIKDDIVKILMPRIEASVPIELAKLFKDYKLLVNPTGKFIIGGPHGDTGLTGRKIIVDTYGGRGAHGGGAFCLSSDTLVKTENGYKNISDIKKGEFVFTLNENNNNIEIKEVLDIYKRTKNDSYELLEIELDNGEKIKITENHEVLLKNGDWIKARDLNNGDDILSLR